MYQKIRLATLLTLAVMTGAAFAATPQVSNVTMEQIEHTRNVRITYQLAVTNAIITLAIETNGVALPDNAVVTLTGDVNREITAGIAGEIIWQAGRDWEGNVANNVRARITAWTKDNPPQYSTVDLRWDYTATNCLVKYYTSSNAVPYGITDNRYKTDYLLLRRIEATDGDGYLAGSPETEPDRVKTPVDCEKQVQIYLSKPFYIGVYQVTQKQWARVMKDDWPSHFYNESYRNMRPVEKVSYNDIRGLDTQGFNWPNNKHAVSCDSFMGALRERTGDKYTFDLPTEAQWEYACRAGTEGAYNLNGKTINDLGRYFGNSAGSSASGDTTQGTAYVGSYLPNAWGLYDMHGNVFELCLDWKHSGPDPAEWYRENGESDPEGAPTGSTRIRRGGSWSYGAADCRSASRTVSSKSSASSSVGFRIVRHLP